MRRRVILATAVAVGGGLFGAVTHAAFYPSIGWWVLAIVIPISGALGWLASPLANVLAPEKKQ